MSGRVVPIFLLVLAAASASYAQAAAIDDFGHSGTEPENPVFWWSLTDDLSPAELRAIHENDELHQRRYLQAVKAGYRDPLPEERLEAITSFFTGQMTPELFPIWLVFDAYSTHFYGGDRWEAFSKAPTQLAKYGIENSAVQTIIHATLRQLDESQALVRDLAPDSLLFVALARKAEAKVGATAVKESIERRDGTTIALATGRSPAFVTRIIKNSQREPSRETVAVILPQLKDNLSSDDWDRFRLFLLKEAAPMISTIDFSGEGSER